MQLARRATVLRARRWLRSSDLAIILLAVGTGACAGLLTSLLSFLAHSIQHLLYGVGINRLSALELIRHPVKLLALPLGGLLLALLAWRLPRASPPIDVVEANALHGGRIPVVDSLRVCLQTLISNGFGASVGLEAAYAQAGGGCASVLGQLAALRRGDVRILVGAGAGAAIGAAFGAPLAGAFYAFEIVIGAYTPAAIAPVMAAALSATLVTRSLGIEPYLIANPAFSPITTLSYLVYAGLGIVAALAGIGIIRLQSMVEGGVMRIGLPQFWRPIVGGLLLMPIAWLSPQALSSGHGALRLELALQPAAIFLLTVFALKVLASVVSLSFGFRGGLFFASLFLGSLLGPLYAEGVNALAGAGGWPGIAIAPHDAALVGMAALAVAIVGGPMTLALLVLEVTHDFALTGVVITASLCASAFTRARFGYSFSTWRLHLRGAGIRGPHDVGWLTRLDARELMRRDPTVIAADVTIGQFREAVPLGSTSRVLLQQGGVYAGMIVVVEAFDPQCDVEASIDTISRFADAALEPGAGILAIIDRFEQDGAEELPVVDEQGRILGLVTESYVQRRHAEESEKALRMLRE